VAASKFTDKEFKDFLRKQQETKASWEAADAAAKNLNDAAENMKQNSKEQSKISDALGSMFNNFKNSFSFGGGSSGGGRGGDTGGVSDGGGAGGRRNSVPNILNNILNVDRSILRFTRANNDVLFDILDAIRGDQRQKIEERRESASRAKVTDSTGASVGKALTGTGDLLSGAGNLLGGLGGGLGKLLGGAGIAAFLLGAGDAEKIKKNIETLLSIGDGYENRLEFLKDGGTLTAMLIGIGQGLKYFAIGEGATVIADWLSGKLGQENWAEGVKNNIATLLSIADLPHTTGDVAWLATSLMGIGAGLAVFGIGEGIKGGVDGIVKGIDFLTGENAGWAQRVYDELETLLSIAELPHSSDAGWLAGALTKIGLGLAIFGGGKAIEGLSQGFQGIISFFSGDKAGWAKRIYDEMSVLLSIAELPHSEDGAVWLLNTLGNIGLGLSIFSIGKTIEGVAVSFQSIIGFFNEEKRGFAQRIYDEVKTLLSINDLPHGQDEGIGFLNTMGNIALGLSIFAVGNTLAGGLNTVNKILDFFTGGKAFADQIYTQVDKLLSITQIPAAQDGGEKFYATMKNIAEGLLLFTGSNFAASLVNVGTSILEFLSGKSSPFDKIRQLANDADKLEKGANALQKVANALSTFSNIQTGNLGEIDFKGMAENLGTAIPLLNLLAKGGVLKANGPLSYIGLGSDIDFGKGILDPSLKLDQMTAAISKINYVLGRTTTLEPVQGNQLSNAQQINGAATEDKSATPTVIMQGGGQGYQSPVMTPPPLPPRTTGAVKTAPDISLQERTMYDKAYFGAGHR
jgi:hypothetical protein